MILDGWGTSPDPKVSAIDQASTPYIDQLYKDYAFASLRTDGLHVGLPEGQMGNSEVGHMNLGRIVYQDLVKINLAVQNKTLATCSDKFRMHLNMLNLITNQFIF